MIYRDMLFNQFNKQPLRRKLLIIYAVGFLIPIISINILFSYNLYQEQMEFNRKNFENSMEKVRLIIETEIEQSFQYIYDIYINKELYRFLDRNYISTREYLSEKRKIDDIARTISNIRLQNNNIQIYTKNRTIKDDSNFKQIDIEISKSKWYRDFISTGNTVQIYFNRLEPDIISIIRVLNYESSKSKTWDNIIKIDIPLSKFYSEFNELAINEEFYLISNNGDRVLNTKNRLKDYIKYQFTFEKLEILAKWHIEGRIQEINFFNSSLYLGKNLIIISIISIVLIGSMVIYLLSQSFYGRIYYLTNKIRSIKEGNFESVEVNKKYKDEITELALSYNVMTKRIHELINEVSEAKLREKNNEIVKRKAQLNALRSQINPHYLFNVLESIRMKSLIKGEKETGEIIKHLSKSFRHIISWDSNIINIKEELGIAKDFLIVQKYRFGEKLDYDIYIEEECKSIAIPKLTLQPFIENSCIHGIEKSPKNGKIKISITKKHDMLLCSIEDNGIGIHNKNLKELEESIKYFDLDSNHIGFSNAYWRLKGFYPHLDFKIETEEGLGTTIKITIPLSIKECDD